MQRGDLTLNTLELQDWALQIKKDEAELQLMRKDQVKLQLMRKIAMRNGEPVPKDWHKETQIHWVPNFYNGEIQEHRFQLE